MKHQGRELVELKFDTMQHWPEGRELLVWDYSDQKPKQLTAYMYNPKSSSPFMCVNCTGGWSTYQHAAEKPTVTKRRVTRAECAGMAVKHENGKWLSSYYDGRTVEGWNEPIGTEYTDRALTLADALAGRTLGMEVDV